MRFVENDLLRFCSFRCRFVAFPFFFLNIADSCNNEIFKISFDVCLCVSCVASHVTMSSVIRSIVSHAWLIFKNVRPMKCMQFLVIINSNCIQMHPKIDKKTTLSDNANIVFG